MRLRTRKQKTRGFSLVEVIFAFIIIFTASLGAVSSIIYSRYAMELDKQRLAALNYCRQTMESCHSHNRPISHSTVLVPFNTPGTEDLACTIDVGYYDIRDNGTIDWANKQLVPPGIKPVFCRVIVTWNPAGRRSEQTQMVSMQSVIRAGVL